MAFHRFPIDPGRLAHEDAAQRDARGEALPAIWIAVTGCHEFVLLFPDL